MNLCRKIPGRRHSLRLTIGTECPEGNTEQAGGVLCTTFHRGSNPHTALSFQLREETARMIGLLVVQIRQTSLTVVSSVDTERLDSSVGHVYETLYRQR